MLASFWSLPCPTPTPHPKLFLSFFVVVVLNPLWLILGSHSQWIVYYLNLI